MHHQQWEILTDQPESIEALGKRLYKLSIKSLNSASTNNNMKGGGA